MQSINDSVVAIGSFDGVHRGHCKILNFLKEESVKRNCRSVVVTFDPHPRKVLGTDGSFFTINGIEDNIRLIGNRGIDIVVVYKFTEEFAKTPYEDFISGVIIGKLGAKAIIMGPNHAIGKNREGSHAAIKDFCVGNGVDVIEIPEESLDSVGVHSAKIRELMRKEKWDEVDFLLGYKYKG